MDVLNVDRSLLLMLIPLVVVQLILQVVALVDVYRRETVTGGKKWIWVLVIIFGEIIGAALYLILGRKDAGNGGD